jgi:hypothetical protein
MAFTLASQSDGHKEARAAEGIGKDHDASGRVRLL